MRKIVSMLFGVMLLLGMGGATISAEEMTPVSTEIVEKNGLKFEINYIAMHTHRNTFVKKWRLYVKNKDNGTKKFNIEI